MIPTNDLLTPGKRATLRGAVGSGLMAGETARKRVVAGEQTRHWCRLWISYGNKQESSPTTSFLSEMVSIERERERERERAVLCCTCDIAIAGNNEVVVL